MTDKHDTTDPASLLLDDDEFVKLMEREAAAADNNAADLAQKQVWQRLERSVNQKRSFAPSWLAAAALILAVGGGFLFQEQKQPESIKSGGAVSMQGMDFEVIPAQSQVQIKMSQLVPSRHFAILRAGTPPAILWQGSAKDWVEPLLVPAAGAPKICLLEATNADDLNRYLAVISELKTLPVDASCRSF